ncbi:MAG TPA: polysaccharide biosynthesis tyrosine autokinase [Pilimelia sp.]|nr:polysaccharide biosynthesis tyrosine autokinase [Pilimelia sp.]
MELRDYVRALRRDWLLLVVAVGLVATATLILTNPTRPAYRASTVLFVSYGAGNTDPDVTTQRLESYVALLKGPGIASAVKEELHLPLTTEQVQEMLDAEVQPGTVLIVLSATDRSATRAKDVANAAAAHLAEQVRRLETTQPQPAQPASSPVSITVAQATIVSRVSGDLPRVLGFALVLGILVGIAASAARQAMFGTVRDAEDVRRFAGLETIGVISTRTEAGKAPAGSPYYPDTVLVEAFRKLRAALPARISAARTAAEPCSLVLTSSVRREGTTAIACGLAVAMAETGARVVLVDANLREPGVAANFAMNTTRGLTDVLTGTATLADVQRIWGSDRLHIIASGPPVVSPGELVASPAMAEAIRTLERAFDIVLIDAPPLLPVADAVVLGALASGVLIVARTRETRIERLSQAVNLLARADAQLVGAVLNELPKQSRTGGRWLRPGISTGWRRPPAERATLPARPLTEVPSGDSNVILAIGTVRGRAPVIRTEPQAPGAEVVPGTAYGRAPVHNAGGPVTAGPAEPAGPASGTPVQPDHDQGRKSGE